MMFSRLVVVLVSSRLPGVGEGEEEKRWQTDKAREKPFTPGDFGPPTAIAENTPQVRSKTDAVQCNITPCFIKQAEPTSTSDPTALSFNFVAAPLVKSRW